MKQVACPILGLIFLLCAGCRVGDPHVSIAVRAAETEPREDLEKMKFSEWGQTETYYLHDEVFLSETEIRSASVVAWNDHPAVEVLLTETGRELFAEVTARYIGKRLAVLVDGRLACVPVVRDTIHQGKILINGEFTEEQAHRIAEGLARR